MKYIVGLKDNQLVVIVPNFSNKNITVKSNKIGTQSQLKNKKLPENYKIETDAAFIKRIKTKRASDLTNVVVVTELPTSHRESWELVDGKVQINLISAKQKVKDSLDNILKFKMSKLIEDEAWGENRSQEKNDLIELRNSLNSQLESTSTIEELDNFINSIMVNI